MDKGLFGEYLIDNSMHTTCIRSSHAGAVARILTTSVQKERSPEGHPAKGRWIWFSKMSSAHSSSPSSGSKAMLKEERTSWDRTMASWISPQPTKCTVVLARSIGHGIAIIRIAV